MDVGLVFERDTRGKQLCTWYIDSNYARDLNKCINNRIYVHIAVDTPKRHDPGLPSVG